MRPVVKTHLAPWCIVLLWAVAIAFAYAQTLDTSTQRHEVSIQQQSHLLTEVPRLYLSRRMLVKKWTTSGGTFCSGPNG